LIDLEEKQGLHQDTALGYLYQNAVDRYSIGNALLMGLGPEERQQEKAHGESKRIF
jgi:hypothetical protein